MAKKMILTQNEIKKDILRDVIQVKSESHASYKKALVIAVLCAASLVLIELIYPLITMWALSCMIISLVVYYISWPLRIIIKEKMVSMDDYEISTETVSHTHYETYEANDLNSSTKVEYCVFSFKNQKDWQLPSRTYTWTPEGGMCAWHIYDNTHDGDTMIVVTNKKTKKIAVAYHTDWFEYKEAP